MNVERQNQIKESIFQATQSLLETLSTALGPKGLDKMLIKNKKTTVTNDGATILKHLTQHPIHSILANVSAAQDEECGDGTTSVVVLVASLLESARNLLDLNVHPSIICDSLEKIKKIANDYIQKIQIPMKREDLYSNVLTSLSSKIAATSSEMAGAAIEAMEYTKGVKRDIRILKRVGGVIDDIKTFKSILLASDIETAPRKVKMAVVQFCISAPKTNMDSKILINDPVLMEQIIQDERRYILDMCKKIKKTGCTLLIIQKSILRDSLSDLAKHFLKQMNILTINSVERADIEYICKSTGAKPISDVDLLDSFVEVEIAEVEDGLVEIKDFGCTILVKGCDDMVVDEAERSLNDALCVVKCLEELPYLVPGGGAVEMGVSITLSEYVGEDLYIFREMAKAFEIIPYFLAKNAGLYPVDIISKFRQELKENTNVGISVRSGHISDMIKDDMVVQPSKVSKSIINLAIEAVSMILKIDDILPARR